MTTMVTELYDALRDAGASDDKARKAAETLANYDDGFNRLERQIDSVDRKIDKTSHDLDLKLVAVKSDVTLLKWMVGVVITLILPLFFKQFVH
jgi:tetrahydromethanopterin S-methyltransferase subunit G